LEGQVPFPIHELTLRINLNDDRIAIYRFRIGL